MKKLYSFRKLCVAVALVAFGFTAQAQRLEHSIYLGGTLPVGQFNDKTGVADMVPFTGMDRSVIGKEANVGISGTYRAALWFDMGFGEMSPFVEASLYWNSVRSSVRDAFDNTRLGAKPNYLNIPLILGIKYAYPLTDLFKVFGELGIGYDLFFITGNGWRNDNVMPFYRYNTRGAMAWEIGAGTYIGPFVSAGIYYQNLGKHVVTYNSHAQGPLGITADQLNVLENHQTQSRTVGEIAIRIGFHF